MRRFEFQEGTSSKFWEIDQSGNDVTTRWGRIGTAGQEKTKTFASEAKARAEYDSLIREKTSKGYKEAGSAATPSVAKAPPPAPAAAAKKAEGAAAAGDSQAPEPSPASAEPLSPPVVPPGTLPDTSPAARDGVTVLAPEEPSSTEPVPGPQAAAEPVVAWTPALRRKLHPRRNLEAKGFKADAWGAFDEMTKYYQRIAGLWQNSESFKGDEFGPALRELNKRLVRGRKNGEIPEPATPEIEQFLPAVLSHRKDWSDSPAVDHCVAYWAGTKGLAFALRALTASMEYCTAGVAGPATIQRTTANTQHFHLVSFQTGKIGQWLELRSLLAEARDDEWEEARAAAESLRETPDLVTRASLAYLFPDIAAWAEKDAADILASGVVQRWAGSLLTCLSDGEVMRKLITGGIQGVWGIFPSTQGWEPDVLEICLSMVEGAGPAALPALVACLDKSDYASFRKEVLTAVSVLRTDEAFEALASRLDVKEAVAIANEVFAASPARAMRVLSKVAGKGQAGQMADSILTLLVRNDPALAELVGNTLSGAQRKTLDGIRAKVRPPREEAQLAALPEFLVHPPWLKKEKRQETRILELEPLPHTPRVIWPAGLREQWLNEYGWDSHYFSRLPKEKWADEVLGQARLPKEAAKLAAMSDGDARKWIAENSKEATWVNPNSFLYATEQLGLLLWEELSPAALSSYYKPVRLLAQWELRALPGLVRIANHNITGVVELLQPFDAAELALPAALACEKKKARAEAQRWIFNHAEAAAVGLVPVALGKIGPERVAAGNALRFLAANGKEALVLGVAERCGTEAREGVREVLDFDPLRIVPAKVPKLPGFWQPGAFTRPALKGEAVVLPLDAVQHLGTMLAFSRLDEPYAGIARVKELCDEASLAAFSWDLFSAWLVAGAPGKENWAFNALGHFGDDACARKLTPMIRDWPGQAANARAVAGLDVLAAIGTDVALMFLNGIAQKVKFKGLQEKAKEKIEVIAERRGLSPEDLADRLVPDLGLDDDGSLTLDFGPRAFKVGFDEHLRPFVRDAQGKKLPELPRAVKTDDGEKAQLATDAWKALKKDVKTLSAQQILKFEIAMCSGRRWKDDVFRTFFVEHPLVQHLVRRIVWGVFDDGDTLVSTFRVAEDNSFADSGDSEWSLATGSSIGVVHALDLPDDLSAAWGQVFGDYEILQPFKQLGRETYLVTEEERKAKALVRFEGTKVSTGRVLALDHRGWRRGAPQDGGSSWWYEKPLGGGALEAILELEPGIIAGDVMMEPEQKLGKVTVRPSGHGGWGDDKCTELGAIDRVSFSELVRDLNALTS